MAYPLNPTGKEHWSAQPGIRNAYQTMVPLAGNGPWSQALGPTHFSWMFLDADARGAAPRDAARRLVRLPDQSRRSRSGTRRRVAEQHCALSVRGRVRVHARRDQPLRRRAAAGRHRPREPAADPDRRHQVRRAVLGPPGLRAAPARRRDARRGARLHRHRDRARANARDCCEVQRRDQQGGRRRAAQGRALRLLARPRRGAHARRDLGRRLPGRERGAHRRRARSTVSTGGRSTASRRRPFPRADWYLLPDAGRARAALRASLPGAARARRAPNSGAVCTSTTCTGGTSSSTEYQALPVWKDFGAPWVAAIATAGGEAARLPVLAAHRRAACNTRGAATSACS